MFNNYIMNTFFMHKIKFNNKVLDRYQTKAVLCKKKRYLVVAGAGTGKTFTIASKINYLVNTLNVKSSSILCISFTNNSVDDMKKVFTSNNLNIDVMTFHKLAMYILKDINYKISNYNLEYITNEYFESFIYDDNLDKLFNDYIIEENINIDYLKKSIISFINTVKSYGKDISFIYDLIHKDIPYNDKLLLTIIYKIYYLYEEELNSLKLYDFNDLIIKASIRASKLRYFKYKYIIIDEYQDTSLIRYNLIKNLSDRFDLNVICVGDDYQSIYKFNGSDIDLFVRFKKLFKESKILKLKYTYRNPKDVVDISSRFIMKNYRQIKKRLISRKRVNLSINVVYYKDIYKAYINIIKDIDNILILGRNNDDINMIGDISYKDKNINYMTVHKSKGLEEDYVIVINLLDKKFPSINKEYDIFKYIKSKDKYLYEEERRLFYVALTRCKKKVFLFTKRGNESIFIKELIKDYKIKINVFNYD